MDGAVPFDRLASWIERQANIARSEATQVSSTALSSQPVGTANVAPVPPTSTTSVAPSQNMPPPSQTPYQTPSLRTNQQRQVRCKVCQTAGHDVDGCPMFREMTFAEQWKVRVCYRCLKSACKSDAYNCRREDVVLKGNCTCRNRRFDHHENVKCNNAA